MSEWRSWAGGDEGPEATVVRTLYRDGSEQEQFADAVFWNHDGGPDDVVGYKVVVPSSPSDDDLNLRRKVTVGLEVAGYLVVLGSSLVLGLNYGLLALLAGLGGWTVGHAQALRERLETETQNKDEGT